MTTPEALAFLQQHQPLPTDEDLAQNLAIVEEYDRVIEHFSAHPDPRCIALFLKSFGGRNGLGAYELVPKALYPLPYDLVVEELAVNLEKALYLPTITLYWNVNLCTPFVDVALREPLAPMLLHEDSDIRMAAITALSLIDDHESRELLSDRLSKEKDADVIDFLHEMLADMTEQGPPTRKV